MAGTAQRVIKNTGYLYAKMGITMFISLYVTRLILSSLGAADFGIYNIVGGAIGMLGFLNAAMASATQRFMSYSEGEGNKEKQKSIFNVSLVLHVGIAVVVGIALVAAGYFFFKGILNIPDDRTFAAKVVYASLIVCTMLTVINVPYDAVMNAHENMKYYAIIGIVESLLKLSVAFACVYATTDKLIVYGVLMAAIPLVTLSIMKIYCHRHYEECRIAPRRYWNGGLMKEMTAFAGWNMISSCSQLLSHQASNIVLNHFFGTIVNAAQGITYQLSGQLGALSNQVTKVMNPIIVKDAGANDLKSMYNVTSLGSKITFFVTSVIFLPFLLYREFFLTLWLKNVPQYTVQFILLYFSVNMIDNIGIYFSTAISGMGEIKIYSILNSVSCLIPFIGSIVLFSMGYAPTWLYGLMIITSFIKLVIRVYYSHVYCEFNMGTMIINDVLRPTLALVFTLIIGYIVKCNRYMDNLLYVVIFALLSMIFYSITYYLIGLVSAERTKLSTISSKMYRKILRKRI